MSKPNLGRPLEHHRRVDDKDTRSLMRFKRLRVPPRSTAERIFRELPYGEEQAIELVETAAEFDDRCRKFIEAYRQLEPDQTGFIPWAQLSRQAGMTLPQLVGIVAQVAAEEGLALSRLLAAVYQPEVVWVQIQQARKLAQYNDRRAFLQSTGFAPVSKGMTVQFNNLQVGQGEQAQALPSFEDDLLAAQREYRGKLPEVPEAEVVESEDETN